MAKRQEFYPPLVVILTSEDKVKVSEVDEESGGEKTNGTSEHARTSV